MRSITAILLALLLVFNVNASSLADSSSVKEQRLSLKQSIAGAGVGLVVNAAVTEILKHGINEMRPDRSDNGSFPSRHSSYAFTLASIASHELYTFSPFWVTAAHTAANAVGMQRVLAEKHYPGDVLSGAAIGIASSEIGYAVSRLMFGAPERRHYLAENMPGLWAETSALISFGRHGKDIALGCGIESALRISLPTSEYFGLGASARLRSQPVFSHGVYSGMLNGMALSVDAYATTSLFDGSWTVEGRGACGFMRYFNRPLHVASSWSYLVDLSVALSRQVAKHVAVGGRVGCDFAVRPNSDAALAISFFTKAQF